MASQMIPSKGLVSRSSCKRLHIAQQESFFVRLSLLVEIKQSLRG